MPRKSPNTTRSNPPSWRSRGSEFRTVQPDQSEAGALPGPPTVSGIASKSSLVES